MQIILLRGLAREAGHWLEFPDYLRAALGNHCTLHLIDFPGCGRYYQRDALTSIAAMTDHARAEFASALSSPLSSHTPPSSPVLLIGISMGGMVALDWAQRFAQDISWLVLINSSAGNQPFWWRLRPTAWPALLRTIVAAPDTRESLVLKVVSNQRADYTARLTQWLAIQQQHPITRQTIITMLRAAAAFKPKADCKVHGLILASEQDRMVSVRASHALAQQYHWPIYNHPTAGHDLPMDDPQWVAMQIKHWLNQRASNPHKNTM